MKSTPVRTAIALVALVGLGPAGCLPKRLKAPTSAIVGPCRIELQKNDDGGIYLVICNERGPSVLICRQLAYQNFPLIEMQQSDGSWRLPPKADNDKDEDPHEIMPSDWIVLKRSDVIKLALPNTTYGNLQRGDPVRLVWSTPYKPPSELANLAKVFSFGGRPIAVSIE